MRDTRAERHLGWVTLNDQRFPRQKAEDWLDAIRQGLCPFCGEGPFSMVALHVRRMHGLPVADLREMLGLSNRHKASICDPALSAQKSAQARRMLAAEGGFGRARRPSEEEKTRREETRLRRNDARDRSIVADWMAGNLLVQEIAAKNRCHKKTVREALKRAGVWGDGARSRRRQVEIARGIGTPVGRKREQA